MIWENFLVLLCKQEGFTKINRSVGSVLEFQQNEPQNQRKIVTPMNNKVAAISKMMQLPGDKEDNISLYQKPIRVETCNERSQLPNIQCELIG